jgi:hypothetical protein
MIAIFHLHQKCQNSTIPLSLALVIIPHLIRWTTHQNEVIIMATLCSLATLCMVGVMLLGQLPTLLGTLKSGWAMVSGFASGLLAKVKGLFGTKA